MKILVISDSYPPHHGGGYELRCKDVIDSLLERGHRVHILSTRCPTSKCDLHPNESGIHRILYKKSQTKSLLIQILHDFLDIFYLTRYMIKLQPDLIYLWHLGDLSNAIIPYFSKLNIPMIYDEGGIGLIATARILKRGLYFYQNEKDPNLKKWAKKLINATIKFLSIGLIRPNANWPVDMKLLFNCSTSLTYAYQNGVPIDNASVIHSGVDLQKFSYKAQTKIGDTVNILVPGRISPKKGTIDALDLFRKLKEKKIPVHLTIIGTNFSFTYYERIKQIISDLDMNSQIRLMPMVDREELINYYHANSICFFPSYQKNGLSRVPLEAMACGCVVISYGNEGSREIINNSETGFLVAEGGLGEAAIVIEKLRNDATLFKRISENARQKIEQDFSFSRYLDQVESFLFDAYKQSGKSAIKKAIRNGDGEK